VNVTISMDDETLTRVSAEAERAGRSVPSWIAARLKGYWRTPDDKAAASSRIDDFLAGFGGLSLRDDRITLDREILRKRAVEVVGDRPQVRKTSELSAARRCQLKRHQSRDRFAGAGYDDLLTPRRRGVRGWSWLRGC
jgi:hypothetical protein